LTSYPHLWSKTELGEALRDTCLSTVKKIAHEESAETHVALEKELWVCGFFLFLFFSFLILSFLSLSLSLSLSLPLSSSLFSLLFSSFLTLSDMD